MDNAVDINHDSILSGIALNTRIVRDKYHKELFDRNSVLSLQVLNITICENQLAMNSKSLIN